MLFVAAKNRFYDFISQINEIPYRERRNLRRNNLYQHLTTDVVDYFGIQPSNCDKLKINIDKVDGDTDGLYCTLSVEYKRKTNEVYPVMYGLTKLPESILSHIMDYTDNYNHLRLNFKITFPESYPFEPPMWSLVSTDETIRHDSLAYGGLTLVDYYTHLVQMHNDQYRNERHQWFPNISIEKDVLLFLGRINHFDCIGN